MKTVVKRSKLLMDARQLSSGRVDFFTYEEVSKALVLAIWETVLFRINSPLRRLIHYEPSLWNGELRRLI